jgi:hypothetical protein
MRPFKPLYNKRTFPPPGIFNIIFFILIFYLFFLFPKFFKIFYYIFDTLADLLSTISLIIEMRVWLGHFCSNPICYFSGCRQNLMWLSRGFCIAKPR